MKKILSIVAVAVFACALAFNSITNSNKAVLSAVNLANVVALTTGEDEILPWCREGGEGCAGGWGIYAWHPDQRPW